MNYMKRLITLTIALSLFVTSSINASAFTKSLAEDVLQKPDENNENILSDNTEKQDANTAKDAGITLYDGTKEAELASQDGEKIGNEQSFNKAKITKEDVELHVDLKKEQGEERAKETINPEQKVRVIIIMGGESIIETDNKAENSFVTAMRSSMMIGLQDVVTKNIEEEVFDGTDLNVRYHYTWLTNAIAVEVPYGKIEEIEEVSGVDSVILEPTYTIDPQTVSDGGMIGREDTWNAGYTGAGMKIAIIDTGLDYDHPSFADDPVLTDTNATKDSVANIIPTLNATQLYKNTVLETLSSDDVWYSNKIPYGFNYVDENLIIDHDHDQAGEHGTHVAGIAAANKIGDGKAVGVAPDAQLYIMKVFGTNGGAYADDLLAAVEDSLLLDADVINMSLGSPAGFTTESDEIDAIYSRVKQTDTVLAIAAGNSNNSAEGNRWGTDTNLTSNPDNGIVSSPGTYESTTTVASVDNKAIYSYYFQVNGQRMSYDQGSNNQGMSMLDYAGKTLAYAMVENHGETLDDFKNANVEGKIAVVQRGVTSFSDKRQKAQDAGAIACIIYNNTAGTIGMDLGDGTATIPVAAVTMQAGEIMKEAFVAGNANISVSEAQETIPSETAYRMSDFSSWGVSPDLQLKPDITAPGGNIYSTINNGKYGTMSGTSMASPNLAGCAALVKQYVKEQYPDMADSDVHKYVNTLLLNTAEPLMYDDNVTYSPRNQGAGLANAYYAIRTQAFVNVPGSDLPKVSLYDDPKKMGVYTYEFEITNTSDKDLKYRMHTTVQSEGVKHDESSNEDFISMTPVALDADVTMKTKEDAMYIYDYHEDGEVNTADARWLYKEIKNGHQFNADEAIYYDVNGDDTVNEDDVQALLDALVGLNEIDLNKQYLKVAANETKTVSVEIKLHDTAKNYMDDNFENGIYVEGFSYLEALHEGGIDLSVPYMGFYGDWTQSPMLDSGYYWEKEDESKASQYANVIMSKYGNSDQYVLPGINPYVEDEFDISHISLSPNNDGYYDEISVAYIALLRNARTLSFTYEDAMTHEVFDVDNQEYARKSSYSDASGQIIPFVYPHTEDYEVYDFTDENGEYLEDGRKVNLIVSGNLEYAKHDANNTFDTWTVPITVDTTAPEITMDEANITVDSKTGKQYIEVSFKDGVGVAAMNFLNTKGTTKLAQYPVTKAAGGEEVTMKFDITGFGSDFLMVPGDYACNESTYVVHTENNDPVIDTSLLYGYRVSDKVTEGDALYGWIAMNKEDSKQTKIVSSEPYMDYALNAAEYVGGYILAVDTNNKFVWIKPGYWDERIEIADLDTTIEELAFDPISKTLYGYDSSNQRLVTIDIMNGKLTPVGMGLYGLVAMTAGNDGTLYGIDQFGDLKTIQKNTGEWQETVTNLNKFPFHTQSMTYDSETESIYWAYYGESEDAGKLYRIDTKDEYAIHDLGVIAGNAEVVGLLFMNERGYQLPEAEAESIHLSNDRVSMLIGQKQSLDVLVTPWYSNIGNVTWRSEDIDVAVVDKFGNVTAVGVGETEINAVTADGKFEANCTIHVVNPTSELNGFIMSSADILNQWVSFGADDAQHVVKESEVGSLTYSAGEYVNGYIYAYSSTGVFYRINADTLTSEKLSENREAISVMDMTFDYSTGYMYSLVQNQDGVFIAQVDIMTGDYEILSSSADSYGSVACAMAASSDGTLYVMAQNGILYTYNKDNQTLNKVGYSGYSGSQFIQSMTFDHNTNELYWAMLSVNGAAMLMYIDQNNGQALPLGAVNGGAEVSALYSIPEKTMEIPYQAVESVTLKKDTMTVIAGSQAGVALNIRPFNATNKQVTWTMEDADVAVIENNIVKAKNAGTTKAYGILKDKDKTYNVELNLNVVPSAGAIRGYVLNDIASGAGQFWSEIYDNDLSKGNGLVDASDNYVYAGEYYDGNVYTYGVNKENFQKQFMIFKEGTFTYTSIKGDFVDINDMTFDYSQGAMYGVGTPFNTDSMSTLYAIDINTGETFSIATLKDTIKAIACSTDGHLYGMSGSGTLYEINKQNGDLREIGKTGLQVNQYQSMAFDHTTGNLYWSYMYFDSLTERFSSGLKLVNPNTADITSLGLIGEEGCQFTAMYIKPDPSLKPSNPGVTGVSMDQSSALLQVGNELKLKAVTLPITVNGSEEITFTSSDPNVATVSKDGTVNTIAKGNVVITASSHNYIAQCSINVVDSNKKFYAVNSNGWQTSSILDAVKTERTELLGDAKFEIDAATYQNDYFYAIDKNGLLWKFNESQSDIVRIGDVQANIAKDRNVEVSKVQIADISVNAFNQKTYVLANIIVNWTNNYAIYEVDNQTGAVTFVMIDNNQNLTRVGSFAFVSEHKAIAYDLYDQTIKSIDIKEAKFQRLSWAQNTVDSGENAGMYYSKELDTLFYACTGFSTNKVTIFSINTENGNAKKLGNADYDSDLQALILKE